MEAKTRRALATQLIGSLPVNGSFEETAKNHAFSVKFVADFCTSAVNSFKRRIRVESFLITLVHTQPIHTGKETIHRQRRRSSGKTNKVVRQMYERTNTFIESYLKSDQLITS